MHYWNGANARILLGFREATGVLRRFPRRVRRAHRQKRRLIYPFGPSPRHSDTQLPWRWRIRPLCPGNAGSGPVDTYCRVERCEALWSGFVRLVRVAEGTRTAFKPCAIAIGPGGPGGPG